jgi:flagellar protein FlaG
MASDVRFQAALPPVTRAPSAAAAGPVARTEARGSESVWQKAAGTVTAAAEDGTSTKDLTRLVEELSGIVQAVRRELEFSVDEDSGRIVVRVTDAESGELIRQIPPEEVLTLMSRFREQQQVGLIQEQA